MTNSKLTDERVLQRLSQFEGEYKVACVLQDDDFASECADIVRVLREVLERRNADGVELIPANLISKFYERYPVESFKIETERAEALGYFMAGAELQCFGEFVKYEELCGDE
ncbi:hypothetical protein ACFPQV_001702 [Salmonella enterica]